MKTFPFFIFRINKSNEKSTFLLKGGEGNQQREGSSKPLLFYIPFFLKKKKKKKDAPFLHILLTLVPLSHT